MIDRKTFPSSTALTSAAYDPERQELTVTFKSGRSYTCHKVPQEAWEELRDADSPGTVWREQIKDQYS